MTCDGRRRVDDDVARGGGRFELPVGRDGQARRLEPPRRLRDRERGGEPPPQPETQGGPVGGDVGKHAWRRAYVTR